MEGIYFSQEWYIKKINFCEELILEYTARFVHKIYLAMETFIEEKRKKSLERSFLVRISIDEIKPLQANSMTRRGMKFP